MNLNLNNKQINSNLKNNLFSKFNSEIDSFFNENNKINDKIIINKKIKKIDKNNSIYFTKNTNIISPNYYYHNYNITDKNKTINVLNTLDINPKFNFNKNVSNNKNFLNNNLVQENLKNKFLKYKFLKTLGKGSYAKVKEVKDMEINKNFAVKIFKKKKLIKNSHKQMILNEINILKSIDYEGIVKYIDDFEDNDNYYIIMTKGTGITIDNYLKNNNFLFKNEYNIYKIFIQLVNSIKYLHERNIFHRDLKLENIIFNNKNNKIILLDLGFSLKQEKVKKIGKLCGTPYYISPEIFLKNEHFLGPVDCWALGILLFKLSTGIFPFLGENLKEIALKIIKDEIIFPENLSHDLKDLIKKLLDKNPNKRLTVNQILNHDWIKKFKLT